MRVTFSAFGHLRQFLPNGRDSLEVELPERASVVALLERFGITWGEVGIIQVNGRFGDEDTPLREGDRVELFAPVGGGQALPDPPLTRADLIRMLNPFGRLWLRLWARILEVLTDLLPRTVNYSWITTSVAVGGSFRRSDIRRLAAAGIDAIVDVRAEMADDAEELARQGIQWLHLPARDHHALSQEQLAHGAEWVVAQIAEGRRVLIHCEHGVGRSPLLAGAVLVKQGYTVPAALDTLRGKRWQAAPNDRQLEALLAFEANHRQSQPRSEA